MTTEQPTTSQPSSVPGQVLVTGAAGFIGANVCELLLKQGSRVVGVDNFSDAYDTRLKHWRLEQLMALPGFTFHPVDITDRAALEQTVFAGQPFDAVINLAARAGVRQSVENPWIYIDTNVTGTLNLLELCRMHGIQKFVLASTSSLYGANNPRPFREDANTDGPLSPYAASKKAAEGLCYTYHYLYQLDITIFRYFTVYGPAGRPDMSIFRFIQWIDQGRPVKIFGDGQQERDFTYVDDIARGTVAGLRPLGYRVINLGSDTPVVLMHALKLVEQFLGKSATLDHVDRHPADVRATWANIGKAEEVLGWRPQLSFEEGVRRSVEWYQANYAWARDIQTG
jgi:nucleoside-diphosphate-sugar epimerase